MQGRLSGQGDFWFGGGIPSLMYFSVCFRMYINVLYLYVIWLIIWRLFFSEIFDWDSADVGIQFISDFFWLSNEYRFTTLLDEFLKEKSWDEQITILVVDKWQTQFFLFIWYISKFAISHIYQDMKSNQLIINDKIDINWVWNWDIIVFQFRKQHQYKHKNVMNAKSRFEISLF